MPRAVLLLYCMQLLWWTVFWIQKFNKAQKAMTDKPGGEEYPPVRDTPRSQANTPAWVVFAREPQCIRQKLNLESMQATTYLSAGRQFGQKQNKAECQKEIFECEEKVLKGNIKKSEHVIDKSHPQSAITCSWLKIGKWLHIEQRLCSST